jgi:hypothetical protein
MGKVANYDSTKSDLQASCVVRRAVVNDDILVRREMEMVICSQESGEKQGAATILPFPTALKYLFFQMG